MCNLQASSPDEGLKKDIIIEITNTSKNFVSTVKKMNAALQLDFFVLIS